MVLDTGRDMGTAWLILLPDPAAVGVARRFVAETCSAGSTGSDLSESAILLASEIVTNAFIHGRSEARIAVFAGPDQVRVEVADDNSRHPRRLDQDPDALDGRGLAIVDLIAAHWGVRDDTIGKTVWFEVNSA